LVYVTPMPEKTTVIHLKLPPEMLALADRATEALAADPAHATQGTVTRTYTVKKALFLGLSAIVEERVLREMGLAPGKAGVDRG